MSDWRRQFYAVAYSEDARPNTKKRAFQRAASDLKSLGLVGHFGRYHCLAQSGPGEAQQ